jgi:hypothetical protein
MIEYESLALLNAPFFEEYTKEFDKVLKASIRRMH